jgi:methyl-accepting chemotaxis protein
MLKVDDSYQGLLDRDASAALRLTQSNRSLETARASISRRVTPAKLYPALSPPCNA